VGFQEIPYHTGGKELTGQASQATKQLKTEATIEDSPVAEALAATPETEIQDLCSELCNLGPNVTYYGYLTGDEQKAHDIWKAEDPKLRFQADLISLEDLLTGQVGIMLERLERFTLASILASSLLQLQATPWLAGKLEKRNIKFYHQGS
jgi:hypothetical protein